MIKNVLPFFLNGGIQVLTDDTTTEAWNGKASFVHAQASGAKEFTLGLTDENGQPIKPGTLVVIMKVDADSNAITVNPTPDMSSEAPSVELNGENQMCMFMLKAPYGANKIAEWVLLAKDSDTTFTGGTVGANTTFSADVQIDGSVGFFGTTPQAQAADPGTATGTDATVINAIVTALQGYGLLA
jgi:hypothetical protein